MGRSVTLIGEVIQGSVPALKTGDGKESDILFGMRKLDVSYES